MTDEELKVYVEDKKKFFTSPDIAQKYWEVFDNQENMKERYRN